MTGNLVITIVHACVLLCRFCSQLTAYERRELEVSRSVINDLEAEIARLTGRITDIRSGTTNLAMNKQSIIEDKNKRIQELLAGQERLLAQLAEQRAQMAEVSSCSLRLLPFVSPTALLVVHSQLDQNAQRKQMIDLRRQMANQKDRDEELIQHVSALIEFFVDFAHAG
jgi:hypothetical protein